MGDADTAPRGGLTSVQIVTYQCILSAWARIIRDDSDSHHESEGDGFSCTIVLLFYDAKVLHNVCTGRSGFVL